MGARTDVADPALADRRSASSLAEPIGPYRYIVDVNGMCTIAELTVSADAFLLSDALSAAPEMSVRLSRGVSGIGSRMIRFRADGGAFETFESRLDADATVTDVVHVSGDGTATEGGRLYRAVPTQAAGPLATYADEGTFVQRASGSNDRWELTIRFDDRDRLARFQEHCGERGVSFTVRRVADDVDEDEWRRYGLTPTQYETLLVAFEEGYFGVPQGTTLGELATQFGISQQALSTRLHRAQRNLFSVILERDSRGARRAERNE